MSVFNDRRAAYALLALGIAGILITFLIDPIRGYDIYLATSQIVVLVVSIVLALAGAYLVFVRKPPVI